jgi:predicted porin
MKKTLIAAAVMAASGVAFAASNVTLYGVIEEGVVVSKAKHKDTLVNLKSGFDSGNRWGLRGVEDLGNGYSVGFILEQGFTANNGDEGEAGKAFNREAILSVKGGFGSLAFGRTGGLAFAQSQAIRTGWVFGTGYGAAGWNAIDWVAKRMNNTISYASPAFAGFTVHAMYSNGVEADTNKWSDNSHYYGIGVKYNANNILSSLIFEAVDNKGTAVPAQTFGDFITEDFYDSVFKEDGDLAYDDVKDDVITEGKNAKKTQYGLNFGFEWNLGTITPMFGYQYVWQDGGNKDHQFGLSAKAPVAGGTVKVGARYTFGKNDGAKANEEDKHNAWLIGAAYEYPLSKRTIVKSYAGYAHAAKAWKKQYDTSYNGYQVYLGLCHSF